MKRLIIASNNKGKIEEIKSILKDIPLDIKSLEEENIFIDVEEDGTTFEENSKKKACEIKDFLLERGDKDFIVLADDSGLEVDYLNGEPGVYSARYAGNHGDDGANNKKLLEKLKGIKWDDRTGRFVCHISLVAEDGSYTGIRGEVKGKILEELNGAGGFGYDPLFYYEPFGKSFGETTKEEKNKVSHRGIALKGLKAKIQEMI